MNTLLGYDRFPLRQAAIVGALLTCAALLTTPIAQAQQRPQPTCFAFEFFINADEPAEAGLATALKTSAAKPGVVLRVVDVKNASGG